MSIPEFESRAPITPSPKPPPIKIEKVKKQGPTYPDKNFPKEKKQKFHDKKLHSTT